MLIYVRGYIAHVRNFQLGERYHLLQISFINRTRGVMLNENNIYLTIGCK